MPLPRQGGRGTRAPSLPYVVMLGRARGRVCCLWFSGEVLSGFRSFFFFFFCLLEDFVFFSFFFFFILECFIILPLWFFSVCPFFLGVGLALPPSFSDCGLALPLRDRGWPFLLGSGVGLSSSCVWTLRSQGLGFLLFGREREDGENERKRESECEIQ